MTIHTLALLRVYHARIFDPFMHFLARSSMGRSYCIDGSPIVVPPAPASLKHWGRCGALLLHWSAVSGQQTICTDWVDFRFSKMTELSRQHPHTWPQRLRWFFLLVFDRFMYIIWADACFRIGVGTRLTRPEQRFGPSTPIPATGADSTVTTNVLHLVSKSKLDNLISRNVHNDKNLDACICGSLFLA